MSSPEPGWAAAFLAGHPAIDRSVHQIIMLYDAAEVLDELQPPHGDTAAAFLRDVGSHVARDLGGGEDFAQALIHLISSRPPALRPTAEGSPS